MDSVVARSVGREEIERVLMQALSWAERREYAGWDPYDGLNSPLLSAICWNWLTRLIGIQLVNRSPINLRPVLGVPFERNPKGIALFARSYLSLYELTVDEQYLTKAESLLSWLAENRSPHTDAVAWGYNFDWQNGTKFYLPAHHPCVVVSVFCGDAFFHHWRVTGDSDSLQIAAGVADFLTSEINTLEVAGHSAYSYTPYDSFVVVNANALAGRYLARIAAVRNSPGMKKRADELMAFVVDVQTDDGAWYYAMPPTDSHLSHDNFHTGYVLESLRDYMTVRSDASRAANAYERGLEFYRTNLFESNGAPRFDHETPFPRDVHGAAQGIRTFLRDGREEYHSFARTIVDWSIEHLRDESGYFYRRRGRFFDDSTPYIRWSQAWMCFALSSYLARGPDGSSEG